MSATQSLFEVVWMNDGKPVVSLTLGVDAKDAADQFIAKVVRVTKVGGGH